ncbi:UDP-N-acetylglucosamine 4,6-dehydratase [Candidatus Methylopumilus universalis]|uniref:polysaccharide biosynthesis protein n=1 Tax=Candidatus Methylopumilus universalis TaxID=2588536 RepID=UPI0011226B79|nr:polysaccharide biosynthesis protein [Candidatus Methylopumilus universalis]QDC70727.1 UDP-N-acetylglucosamine 4,6-dehydratase [Candidatus Methylopumilus universalis]
MNVLKILNRQDELFNTAISKNKDLLVDLISGSSILVVGGAGSIGKSVCLELIKYAPKLLHIVDISENNLVELVRLIRSSDIKLNIEFDTFAIDINSRAFDFLTQKYVYQYILNLSALKHVRSEKDPFTLLRLIEVNIFNSIKLARLSSNLNCHKYFAVSTDKAANPVNLMGASKRIMEKFLVRESNDTSISLARFANVAFSDGSLLYGFQQRIIHKQPLAAPKELKRFFITHEESGRLCVLSAFLGNNLEIFFPNNTDEMKLVDFEGIATRFLESYGYEPFYCSSEEQAKTIMTECLKNKKWPIYIFNSDTTGEKPFEEFYTVTENKRLGILDDIGIINLEPQFDSDALERFEKDFIMISSEIKLWRKENIVELFRTILPELNHEEKNKFLNGVM